MDIGSKSKYPANSLSNFSPHGFVIDGVKCASMEGFLQSLKFSSPEMQEHVCSLIGSTAKKMGAQKNWQSKQTLFWRGVPIHRDSNDYQALLDKAFAEMSSNRKFAKALLASGDATLTHSMGKNKKSETVLTTQEFVSRLTKLRTQLRS